MNSFAQLKTEDRRLVILRFLAEEPSYQLNTSILHSAVCSVGHSCSRDQVTSDCAWLDEQGLLACEINGLVTICTLTERGLDVAQGRAVVPGVKRPSPR